MSFIADHAWLIVAVIAAGIASGFCGGLFGIGGGIVTVPALYAVFQSYGIAEEPSLKTAIGTSLAVIIATSLASLSAHHRAGQVDMRIVKAWGPWIAIGAAIGGLASRYVPGEALAAVFAVGAGYIGFRRLFGKRGQTEDRPDLTEKRIHIPIGVGTGLFSSLMGLGGGAVGVMVMTWSGRSIHQAVATASGFGVAVALPGAAGFALSGFGHHDLPPLSLGYVNLPAFAAMALMSALAAPAGARLAHRMKGDLLSKLFGLYILAAALSIAIDMFGG